MKKTAALFFCIILTMATPSFMLADEAMPVCGVANGGVFNSITEIFDIGEGYCFSGDYRPVISNDGYFRWNCSNPTTKISVACQAKKAGINLEFIHEGSVELKINSTADNRNRSFRIADGMDIYSYYRVVKFQGNLQSGFIVIADGGGRYNTRVAESYHIIRYDERGFDIKGLGLRQNGIDPDNMANYHLLDKEEYSTCVNPVENIVIGKNMILQKQLQATYELVPVPAGVGIAPKKTAEWTLYELWIINKSSIRKIRTYRINHPL